MGLPYEFCADYEFCGIHHCGNCPALDRMIAKAEAKHDAQKEPDY